jgi:hypothetical protein
MRGFSYFAENTIQTSADGRRTLAVYGPFARPFELSGPDTEERIVQRLACAYRLSVIPLLALVLLLCRWPNKHVLFAGLAATAVVVWLVVWAFLYPDLRWLKRADRPSRVGANSAAEFVGQLEPGERTTLIRRRLFLLAGFLGSCIYAIIGVWMLLDGEWFGYVTLAFFGFCGFKWGRIASLPPEALLKMPFSVFHFSASDDPESKTSSSETQDRDNPVAGKPEFSGSSSGLWDREIDGNT